MYDELTTTPYCLIPSDGKLHAHAAEPQEK